MKKIILAALLFCASSQVFALGDIICFQNDSVIYKGHGFNIKYDTEDNILCFHESGTHAFLVLTNASCVIRYKNQSTSTSLHH